MRQLKAEYYKMKYSRASKWVLVFMAFIFWQPSDSSPPLFRPPLSELFSSGVENCLFRQNPSEAFHQVKEGLGGVLLQRRLNAGKKKI